MGSWDKVIQELESARRKLRCSNSGAFYRGHSSLQHKLVPSLLRAKLGSKREADMYAECLIRIPRTLNVAYSSWERLAVLQHYGIPTRLLDWTDSFAVAVFFAVEATSAAANLEGAHVYVANGFELNKGTGATEHEEIVTIGFDEFPDYRAGFLGKRKAWKFKKPVFIEIPWSTDRIAAQKGYFTVHGSAEPMEKTCAPWLCRIAIPAHAIEGAKSFLELAGVNQHSVFPDLEGLGRFLRAKYRLDV